MPKKKRFDSIGSKRKFNGKNFTFHSLYVGGRTKIRAEKQKKRWKKLGYNVRLVVDRGSMRLYRRKK